MERVVETKVQKEKIDQRGDDWSDNANFHHPDELKRISSYWKISVRPIRIEFKERYTVSETVRGILKHLVSVDIDENSKNGGNCGNKSDVIIEIDH